MLQWYRAYREEDFAVPAIALYEIQAGAEVTRRQDEGRAKEIEAWAQTLITSSTVLDLDAESAREAARLMFRQTKYLIEDAMIAAIAKVHSLTIATRNVRDFERFDVPLVNPFTFGR